MAQIHSLIFRFVAFCDQNKTQFNSAYSLLNSLVSDTHFVKVHPYTKVFEVFSIYYFFILSFYVEIRVYAITTLPAIQFLSFCFGKVSLGSYSLQRLTYHSKRREIRKVEFFFYASLPSSKVSLSDWTSIGNPDSYQRPNANLCYCWLRRNYLNCGICQRIIFILYTCKMI